MALLKFISLSVGSLMLVQAAYGSSNTVENKDVNCLDVLNAARTEVGLEKFAAITDNNNKYITKDSPESTLLDAVCKQIEAKGTIIISEKTDEPKFPGTTTAYAPKIEDCSAAVAAWKKGFSSFKTDSSYTPPAFTVAEAKSSSTGGTLQTGQAPYNTPEAVNFIALYSGQATSSVECAVVNCAKDVSEAFKALVCMTYPSALKAGDAPYKGDQWKNIVAKLTASTPSSPSSASAAVPTLLALAAAAVGVALM